MKNLFKYVFLCLVVCLISCDKAEYKPVKVFYQNGDTETISVLQDNSKCYIKDGCLYSIYTTAVRCGVRRFENCK